MGKDTNRRTGTGIPTESANGVRWCDAESILSGAIEAAGHES